MPPASIGARLGAKRERHRSTIRWSDLWQYGVRGMLTPIGAALLLMIVVVGWLGAESERKVEETVPIMTALDRTTQNARQ